jgi:hypothetical protein
VVLENKYIHIQAYKSYRYRNFLTFALLAVGTPIFIDPADMNFLMNFQLKSACATASQSDIPPPLLNTECLVAFIFASDGSFPVIISNTVPAKQRQFNQ